MQNGIVRMRREQTLRLLAVITLLALVGCGSNSRDALPVPDGKQPQTLTEQRIAGHHRLAQRRLANRPTREELAARRLAFRNVLPPEAYVALERAGFASPAAVSVPAGKQGSTALPAFVGAYQPYGGPGDAGYFASSSDVVFTAPPDFPEGAAMSPAGAAFPDNFSYIIYRVDDVTQVPGALEVSFNPSLGEFGICVYNWAYGAKGRWEPLYYGDTQGGFVSVGLGSVPGAAWVNAQNNLAFALFTLNPNTLDVNSFTLDEALPNEPPQADLFANPGSGTAPLSTQLDASGSFDWDGSIESYNFDPGDGSGWSGAGPSPTFDHTYSDPGAYTAMVEVTDDGGLSSQWQTSVIVSPSSYDEVEDDNDMASAMAFPAIPFSNFSGACGLGSNNGDDTEDWFKFDASPGDKVSFQVQYAVSQGTLDVILWDSTGSWLGETWGDPGAKIDYQFEGWEMGPFFLEITAWDGASDYFITCDDNFFHPDEYEDNDDTTQANYLYLSSFSHEMPKWVGSVGASNPDYPGYDGDSDDWSMLDEFDAVPAGATLSFELTYGTANSTSIGLSLFDANGNQLDSSAGGSGDEIVSHVVQAGDAQPFYVHVHLVSGYGDYNLAGEINIPNPCFDEEENNDNFADANDLGAVPIDDPFTGNVGWGGNYDGDFEDIFTFQANSGEIVVITVTPSVPDSFLGAGILDSNGDFIGGSEADPDTGVVTCKAMVLGGGPFYLDVNAFDISTDYGITASLGSLDEVEDNDTEAQANELAFGYIPFFAGSVGSGGSNYDGDNLDMFSFASAQGVSPYFDFSYDPATGIGFTALIKDAAGTVLGVGSDPEGSGHYHVQTDMPIDTFGPYYLIVTCPGFSDYWFTGDTAPQF